MQSNDTKTMLEKIKAKLGGKADVDADVKVIDIDLDDLGKNGLKGLMGVLGPLLENIPMKKLLHIVPHKDMVEYIYDIEPNNDSPQHFKDALAGVHKSLELMALEEARKHLSKRTPEQEWSTACHESAHAVMIMVEPEYTTLQNDILKAIWLNRASDPSDDLVRKLNFRQNGLGFDGMTVGTTERDPEAAKLIAGCLCDKHIKEAVKEHGKEAVVKALNYQIMVDLAGAAATSIAEKISPQKAMMTSGKSDAKSAVRVLKTVNDLTGNEIKPEDAPKLILEEMTKVKVFLKGQWRAVEAVAKELVRAGHLEADTVRAIVRANWNPDVKLAF